MFRNSYWTIYFAFFLVTSEITVSHLDEDEDARCMTWAMRRIVGHNTLKPNDIIKSNTSLEATAKPETMENEVTGLGRPGKRGPSGPPGERGHIGPPGVCECIPKEVRVLQKQNEVLKDQIKRIRTTSPETFCLLGMKDGSIPDDAITVSSAPERKKYGRLDNIVETWHPVGNSPGSDWIMADIGRVRLVTGVVTQGRISYDQWTTTFKVEHSANGLNFTDVKKSDGSELIFPGNTDRTSKVVNRFPEPVETRFVRIYPITYSGYTMVRFDIIDC